VGVRNKIVDPTHDKIMFIEILVSYLTAEDFFYSFPVSKNAFRCYVLCSKALVFEDHSLGSKLLKWKKNRAYSTSFLSSLKVAALLISLISYTFVCLSWDSQFVTEFE